MVMQAVRQRPAPGAQGETQPMDAPEVEHPSEQVLKIWGFLISEGFARIWTIFQTLLPYACVAANCGLMWRYLPSLTETQLYGLIQFSVFSLVLCWIGRK